MGDFIFNEAGNSALTQCRSVGNLTDVDIKFIPSSIINEDDLYIKVEPLISEEIDVKQEVTAEGMELQFSDSSCKEIKCEAAAIQVKEENDVYIKLEPRISEEVSIKEEITVMANQDKFIAEFPDESCIHEELPLKEEIKTIVIDDSSDEDVHLASFNVQAKNFSPGQVSKEASVVDWCSDELQPHSQPSLHWCEFCRYAHKKRSKVLTHMMIHLKPYSCEKCSYKTAVKASLRDHFRDKHSGVKHLSRPHSKDKPFKCILCPFETRKNKVYQRHFKRMHNQGKPFKCDECSFETRCKRDLLNHMNTQSGDNYLKCSECEYRTLSKSCLITHVKSHLTHFSRDKRGYKTALKATLANHSKKRRHTSDMDDIKVRQEVTAEGMELQFSDSSCKESKRDAAVQVKEEHDIYIKLEPLMNEDVVLREQNDNFINN